MQTPRSSRYEFLELFSDHPPVQAWRAINRESGDPCFVKCSLVGSALAGDTLISMQMGGVKLQRRIKSTLVVRARSAHMENGDLFVEYPLLDAARWSRLTPELFWLAPGQILKELCLTIDYLHLLGLVHGDVKLDNFLMSAGVPYSLRLIDLDFLSRENSRPQARLFGTHEHIAPEICDNTIIAPQSDNYSLGVSLGKAVEWLDRSAFGDPGKWKFAERLRGLIAALTRQEYLQRPYDLLTSCREFDLLDAPAFDAATHRLLGAFLLSRVRWPRSITSQSADRLARNLRSKLGLFGIPSDLVTTIHVRASQDPHGAYRMVRKLLSEADIGRFDKFFFVKASDDQAWSVLSEAGTVTADPAADSATSLIEQADTLTTQNKPLAAYLLLKRATDNPASHHWSPDQQTQLLRRLSDLASRLNRLADAHSYLCRAVEIHRSCGDLALATLGKITQAAIRINRIDATEDYLREADTLPGGSTGERLELQRDRAWVLYARGNYSDAETLLDRLVSEADQHDLTSLRISARYARGIIAWRRADSTSAFSLLTEALRLARQHNQLSDSPAVLAMLALIYADSGFYLKAAKAARAALHVAAEDQTPKLAFVYDILLLSYLRLAQFNRARYWLQEYLNKRYVEGTASFFAYQLDVGVVEADVGRLREACTALMSAYRRAPHAVMENHQGKTCQNLALIELWRGRVDRCRAFVAEAREALASRKDPAALAEIDCIEAINDRSDNASQEAEKFLELASKLQQLNGCYYACIAAYWALLLAPKAVRSRIPAEVRTLVVRRDSRLVPLFAALHEILRCYGAESVDPRAEISAWKSAFMALYRGRQIFLALHAATKLAQLYTQTNHPKHARKYLLQARVLARSLENEPLQAELSHLLTATDSVATDHTRLVDSYLSISEMLRNISDYQQAMRRVVEFAVEQTGAERGILFLKRGDRDDFQIGASVNCDQQSLQELSDFSSNLPWLSTQDQAPLLIENAMQDDRTSKYHSVIQHNILSVACVPLWDAQVLRGVLYLDHHTIPSLFEPDDIRYLMTLANFLTLILTTASTWRTITLTNVQLQDELSRLGKPGSLVTSDAMMLRMLEKIPQIARTSTSVLIQGENGTGKEILCDMIHKLSLRSTEPFIKLNCATLSQTLLESELFGIARNVATGVAEREGKLAAADGGTLLLDEIGDMPPEIQAKVLRAIEYQQFEKVGSNRPIRTDIRFLYATNRDLAKLVSEGKFRQDLYYRINTIVLEIPPLRRRRADIPLLIDHFFFLLSQGAVTPRFSSAALDLLVQYSWPGNVRQLKNLVENCLILYPGSTIEPSMLPREVVDAAGLDGGHTAAAEDLEKARIVAALKKTNSNLTQAAKLLGMALSTLRRRIKKHGLENLN